MFDAKCCVYKMRDGFPNCSNPTDSLIDKTHVCINVHVPYSCES